MKKPVVDYRKFRFSKLNDPEFAHLKYLAGWLGYFALYFLTENLIPFDKCHVIHARLDDLIPFREEFLLFYCFWYVLIVISLLHFMLYDTESFKKLQSFIIITQIIGMFCYIVWPSMQDLRPVVFPRDNFLTHVMAFIYSFDTPTGVCPSLHVAYSLGIGSVWTKRKETPVIWKVILWVIIFFICISTAFVKQHSVIDIAAALPVGLAAELILYWKSYWRPKMTQRGQTPMCH